MTETHTLKEDMLFSYDVYNDILHLDFQRGETDTRTQRVSEQLDIRRCPKGVAVGVCIRGVTRFDAQELEDGLVPNQAAIKALLEQVRVPYHNGMERIGETSF